MQVYELGGKLPIVSALTYRVQSTVSEIQIEDRLGVELLAKVIINFDIDGIEYYGSLVATLERNEYRSKPKKSKVGHEES